MVANHTANCNTVVYQPNMSYHYLSAPTGYSLSCDWRLAATVGLVGALVWSEGMAKGHKKTPEDYKKLGESRDFIWLGPEVNNVTKKTNWQCPFGHIWDASFMIIQLGHGCRYCSHTEKKKEADFHSLAECLGLKWVSDKVINTYTKTEWECSKGHRFWSTYGIYQSLLHKYESAQTMDELVESYCNIGWQRWTII